MRPLRNRADKVRARPKVRFPIERFNTSTIILWAIIGLIALATTMVNKDNEKTPSNTMIGMVKGMLAATSVLSFFTILATILAFMYYEPFM